jgi:hypothetical protein
MDDIERLKAEIAELKELTTKKQAELYRAEQGVITAEKESIASTIRGTTHSLICPFCGVTLTMPPTVGSAHMGCYSTGYWSRGFRTHSDWIRACIENGAKVSIFMEKNTMKRI